jgi:hypothetical protein
VLCLASEGGDDEDNARGVVRVSVSVRVIKIQRTSHGMAWHGLTRVLDWRIIGQLAHRVGV